ncbi:hypothetical protein [Streptomyces sp. NPDC093600]|uniref:hypothetical protein n=1 Tax=Streptomyces sp. NPDC093600 TaxID=3366047 RepID=UPI0037F18881
MTRAEVLGRPEYAPRFGSVPASRFGAGPGVHGVDEAMTALVVGGSCPVSPGAAGRPVVLGG